MHACLFKSNGHGEGATLDSKHENQWVVNEVLLDSECLLQLCVLHDVSCGLLLLRKVYC